jgi:hypothetical protein
MGPKKKKQADSKITAAKRRKMRGDSGRSVTTESTMVQTITSVETQNVLGELRKAGMFSRESVQTENNPETSSQIETSQIET